MLLEFMTLTICALFVERSNQTPIECSLSKQSCFTSYSTNKQDVVALAEAVAKPSVEPAEAQALLGAVAVGASLDAANELVSERPE